MMKKSRNAGWLLVFLFALSLVTSCSAARQSRTSPVTETPRNDVTIANASDPPRSSSAANAPSPSLVPTPKGSAITRGISTGTSASSPVIIFSCSGEPIIRYATPTLNDAIPFQSLPEPGTGVVYSGKVVASRYITGRQTNLYLLLSNDSPNPLPIHESDFVARSIRDQRVLPFRIIDSPPVGGSGRNGDAVPPGVTLSFVFSLNGDASDVQVVWRIKGNLSEVNVPIRFTNAIDPSPPPPSQPNALCP